jgi:hypothetical protein
VRFLPLATRDEAEPDPEMVAHGRQYIWIAIGFLALTSIAVSAFWVYRFGLDRAYLSRVSIRLSLLALLSAFLLQGRAWARWVTVALLVVGMYIAFPVFLAEGAWRGSQLAGTLAMLALYIGYFVIARGLIWSRSVRAFFRAHRRRPPAGDGRGSAEPPWQR